MMCQPIRSRYSGKRFSAFSLLLIPALLALSVSAVFGQDAAGIPAKVQNEEPRADFSPKGPYLGPLEIAQTSRFLQLPKRMLLEPNIKAAPNRKVLDARYVPLFDKMLRESNDAELLEITALGLARIAREKMQDTHGSSDILLQHLNSHSDLRVRFACARALIDGDIQESAAAILALDEFADDSQRLWIEPGLIRWKVATAKSMWIDRLKARQATSVKISLACQGLAALGDADASELLLALINNPLLPYEKRLAAAKSLQTVNPQQAFDAAKPFLVGDVPTRRLAAELLASTNAQAQTTLTTLCSDSSDGVASAAWLSLQQLNPGLLVESLSTGRSHRDAEIRMAASRVMALFPTPERVGWLNELMSDRHLMVRNIAREVSFQIAEEQPPLREQIVSMAGDKLSADAEDWQGIEQSLLLLGQLRATQFSDHCIPLLEHARNEVLVTSAWLLHLFPDEAVQSAVIERLKKSDSLFKNPENYPVGAELGEQSAYLIQYAGLIRLKELQPFLEPDFSKSALGGINKRAAAMWALGLLHEGDSDPALTKSFLARVADRGGMMPEFELIRRISVISLGILRSKAAVPGLLEAYTLDPQGSAIPDSARWSLGMIGEEMPEPLQGFEQFIGGWKLSPQGDP